MVASGYWLKTSDTHWRRVSAEDYLQAMTRTGIQVSRDRPVRAFKADGIRGVIEDPNVNPPRETGRLEVDGRTMTTQEYLEAMGRLRDGFIAIAAAAAHAFQTMQPALAELGRMLTELEAARCETLTPRRSPC